MATVAEAAVQLIPSARGFRGKIESEIGGDLDRAGRAGGQRMGNGLLAGAALGMSRIGPIIGAAALAGVGALGALGGAAIGVGVKTAAAMETAKIGFTTMLGSAQKADSFLKQLADFAAKTPFEFPELQTAASSLISIGIDSAKVIPIMTTLGNVTSGMGTGSEGIRRATVALQQMNAAQRITAEDLNQLRDAGIPVYDLLAGALGKTKEEVAGLAQKGKLGKDALDKMMAALESGKGLERFNGLMAKQSQSLAGLWSTLKDTVTMGLAQAVEPLIPLLKDGLAGAAAAAAKVLPLLSVGLANVITAAVSAGQALAPVAALVVDAFRIISDAFAGFETDTGTGAVGDTMNALMVGAFGVRDAFMVLRDFVVAEVIPRLQGIVTAIQGYLAVALPIVQQFVAGMMERIGPMMPQIREIFATIGQIIVGALDLIRAVIETTTTVIAFIWTNWGQGIMNFAGAVFASIIGIIGPALQIIRSIIQTVTSLIKGDWSGAWEGVQGIVRGAWDLILAIVRGGAGILGQVLSAAWGAIKVIAAMAWDGIVSTVSGAIERVAAAVGGVKDAVVGALSNAGTWLVSAGRSIVEGLVAGVRGMAGALVTAIVNLIPGPVQAVVKSALGIASPSKVMQRLGEYTVQGFIQGLGVGDVAGAMGRLVSVPSPAFAGGLAGVGAAGVGGSVSLGGPVRLHPDDIHAIGVAAGQAVLVDRGMSSMSFTAGR